jgi:hypothetical protein
MSVENFSSNCRELLHHPHTASKEQIQVFEEEATQLIKDIKKRTMVSTEALKQYEELSEQIHRVAELNPQLKKIDDAFNKLIKGAPAEHVKTSVPPEAKTKKTTQKTIVAPAVEVPRPIRDNPINAQELQAWIDAHQDPLVKSALTELTKHIRHVSQEEFEASLKETTRHLNEALAREGGGYVVAVEKGKSNQWVAQLAMPDLSKKPMAEVELAIQTYLKAYEARKATDPKVTFPKSVVLFDDAAYSGEQLSRVIRTMITAINTHNERVKEKIPMPKFIVASPYMTNFAEKAIKEKVGGLLIGKGREQYSAIKHLEILPYKQIMTIKELIPDQKTLNVLTRLWWPKEAQLGMPAALGKPALGAPPLRQPFGMAPAGRAHLQADLESTKDLSPSQFAHKRGVESRGTTYFSFKIPDQDSFLGPLAEGKIVINGQMMPSEKTFQIIPRTVPPYKPNFAQFCKEITP